MVIEIPPTSQYNVALLIGIL